MATTKPTPVPATPPASTTMLVDCGKRCYLYAGATYGPGVATVPKGEVYDAIVAKIAEVESGNYPDPYVDGPDSVRRTADQALRELQAQRDALAAQSAAENDTLQQQLTELAASNADLQQKHAELMKQMQAMLTAQQAQAPAAAPATTPTAV